MLVVMSVDYCVPSERALYVNKALKELSRRFLSQGWDQGFFFERLVSICSGMDGTRVFLN